MRSANHPEIIGGDLARVGAWAPVERGARALRDGGGGPRGRRTRALRGAARAPADRRALRALLLAGADAAVPRALTRPASALQRRAPRPRDARCQAGDGRALGVDPLADSGAPGVDMTTQKRARGDCRSTIGAIIRAARGALDLAPAPRRSGKLSCPCASSKHSRPSLIPPLSFATHRAAVTSVCSPRSSGPPSAASSSGGARAWSRPISRLDTRPALTGVTGGTTPTWRGSTTSPRRPSGTRDRPRLVAERRLARPGNAALARQLDAAVQAARPGAGSPSGSARRSATACSPGCSASSCTASRARSSRLARSPRRCRGSTRKLYGSTQVVDEGRHVEVFHRYLTQKLGEALRDQRQPLRRHRRAHERRALGHEVPRHADHDRGPRARRVRHDPPGDARAAAARSSSGT